MCEGFLIIMDYNKKTNTYTLHSFSDYWSNFVPTKTVDENTIKNVIVKDKNNIEYKLGWDAEKIKYPITIQILENGKIR